MRLPSRNFYSRIAVLLTEGFILCVMANHFPQLNFNFEGNKVLLSKSHALKLRFKALISTKNTISRSPDLQAFPPNAILENHFMQGYSYAKESCSK